MPSRHRHFSLLAPLQASQFDMQKRQCGWSHCMRMDCRKQKDHGREQITLTDIQHLLHTANRTQHHSRVHNGLSTLHRRRRASACIKDLSNIAVEFTVISCLQVSYCRTNASTFAMSYVNCTCAELCAVIADIVGNKDVSTAPSASELQFDICSLDGQFTCTTANWHFFTADNNLLRNRVLCQKQALVHNVHLARSRHITTLALFAIESALTMTNIRSSAFLLTLSTIRARVRIASVKGIGNSRKANSSLTSSAMLCIASTTPRVVLRCTQS